MLTQKQEKFVQGIIGGLTQADAYRAAYPDQKMTDKTVWESASKLMNNPKVTARVKELREQLTKSTIMSAQERLEFLTEVIKGTKGEKVVEVVDGKQIEVEIPASLKNRLGAIDIMNRMQGEYVTKIVGDVKISKLEDLL